MNDGQRELLKEVLESAIYTEEDVERALCLYDLSYALGIVIDSEEVIG